MAQADDLLERVRATGLLAPGRPVVVLLSGGRDSVCLLDVAARLRAPARSARCTSTTACAPRPTATRRTAARCARSSASRSRCSARRARGRRNLQAWARDMRLGAGARMAPPPARGWRPATRRPIRPRRSSTGWRRRPDGARCSAWQSATGCRAPAAAESRARRRPRSACARGLSWREDAWNADPTYARSRARANLVPALRALHPSAEAQRGAHRGAAARGGRGARRGRREALRVATRSRSRSSPRCRSRSRGSSCGGWPRTRRAGSARGRRAARRDPRARRRRARSRRRRPRRRQRRRAARRATPPGRSAPRRRPAAAAR